MSVVTLAVCRDCAGMGAVPYNGDWDDGITPMVACVKCGGTGDADAARLIEAYECGRRDKVEQLLAYLGDLAKMVEITTALANEVRTPSGDELRARIGG